MRKSTNALKIDDTLDERVGSTRLFTTEILSYCKNANEVSHIQLDLIHNKLQKKTVPELQKLKQDLIRSFSVAKTQIDHSKLYYNNILEDKDDLKKQLSEETISKKKEQLMKKLFTSKKKIEQLTKKKLEVREINRIIDSFSGIQELSYNEDQLKQIFGDQTDAIKNAPGILKRASLVRVKKEQTDVKMEDKEEDEKNDEKKDDESKKEEDNKVEEFETKEVIRYVFKTNLANSVEKLREIQTQLLSSIEQYENDIERIKRSYIEDVQKFEAIKKILDPASVDQENGIDKERHEDEDVEMGEAEGETPDAVDETVAEVEDPEEHHSEAESDIGDETRDEAYK